MKNSKTCPFVCDNYLHRLFRMKIIQACALFLILLSGCLIPHAALSCQSQDHRAIADDIDDRVKCDTLYGRAYKYVDVDNVLALSYGVQALTMARENTDSLRMVRSGRIVSMALYRLKRIDSALMVAQEFLAIALKNEYTDEALKILNVMGVSYTLRAEYDKALRHYYQSLRIRERSKITEGQDILFNNIGLVYYKMKDYDKALSFYTKAVSQKSKDDPDLGLLFVNISLCYAFKNDPVPAKDYVEKAFESCRDKCPGLLSILAFYSRGVSSFNSRNLKLSETNFLKSYLLAKEINDVRLQMDNVVYLSRIHMQDRRLDLVEKYLDEAIRLIDVGAPYSLELIKIYGELYGFYREVGDYKKVSLYQEKYIQLKDSIYGEELTRNLMIVESQYLERENAEKIASQGRILALNEEVIFRQRVLNVLAGIVAALLAALAIVLTRDISRKKAMNLMLEKKVRERTEELENNQQILKRSLDERVVQFRKIAHEVKSYIATVRGLCYLSLRDQPSVYDDQYIKKIDKASEQMLGTLDRMAF